MTMQERLDIFSKEILSIKDVSKLIVGRTGEKRDGKKL
jgi:hypothetical protein